MVRAAFVWLKKVMNSTIWRFITMVINVLHIEMDVNSAQQGSEFATRPAHKHALFLILSVRNKAAVIPSILGRFFVAGTIHD